MRSKLCDSRVKFWNEDRTQSSAIDIGDLEKVHVLRNRNRKGNLGQIDEENENAPAEDGGTP